MGTFTEITKNWADIPRRYPELSGKVALVTGANRGIGKGIAWRLAAEGMRVVIAGLGDEVDACAAELAALGATVLGVAGDLGSDGDIAHLFNATLEAFGDVDLLVNNAADKRTRRILESDATLFDRQVAVNFRAPYLCSQRTAAIMRDAGHGGSIINISSVGGTRAHFPGLPYDATKGALNMMTRALALDFAELGIRVNAVAPGAINTGWNPSQLPPNDPRRIEWEKRVANEHPSRLPPDDPKRLEWLRRYPAGRVGLPRDIAAAVAFLASPDADYITGEILYVDGGITAQLSPRTAPV